MALLSFIKRRAQRQQEQDGEGAEMSFVEHLDELRMHLIRAFIGISAAAIVMFFATELVFKYVIFGPLDPNFITYKLFCGISEQLGTQALCYTPVNPELQTFDMGEAFLLHIKVCLIGGIIVSFPYVLYEFWKFVRPGLYTTEVSATRGVVGVGSLLFLLGVAFGYFILSPFAINFLVGYQLPMVNEGQSIIKAKSFVNYMIMFTLPAGLIFELPIIVYYLARMGIVTSAGMRQYRRHSIIGILLLSAMITPPDVMTQIIVSIPVYILYELSINIAKKQEKKRNEELGMLEDKA